MSNKIRYIECLFKGHDVNPVLENIVADVMIDKRNWLCRCHRCGLYEMHDGAMSGGSMTLTKKGAMRLKRDLIQFTMEMERRRNDDRD